MPCARCACTPTRMYFHRRAHSGNPMWLKDESLKKKGEMKSCFQFFFALSWTLTETAKIAGVFFARKHIFLLYVWLSKSMKLLFCKHAFNINSSSQQLHHSPLSKSWLQRQRAQPAISQWTTNCRQNTGKNLIILSAISIIQITKKEESTRQTSGIRKDVDHFQLRVQQLSSSSNKVFTSPLGIMSNILRPTPKKATNLIPTSNKVNKQVGFVMTKAWDFLTG